MTVIKRPARLQPGKPSEDLPYGQSGIRRLAACIRCAPASSQSSSIHNSLCSINPATAGCSLQKPTGLFAYRSRGLETFVFFPGKFCELRDFAYGQNLCVLYAKFPPPKAKRLQLVYAPNPTGAMNVREQVAPRPKVSAFRPKNNIIGPKLCNRLLPSSLAPTTSI